MKRPQILMVLFVVAAVMLATAAGCSREPPTSQLGSEKIDLSLPAPQRSAQQAHANTERAEQQEKLADEQDKQVGLSPTSAKPGSRNPSAGEGRTPRKPYASPNSSEKTRHRPPPVGVSARVEQQRRPAEGASAAPEVPSAEAAATPYHERNNPLYPTYKKND